MTQLSKYERQKYAKAMRRVEFGIWGYKLSLFKSVTLTTVQGEDMSVKRFGVDVHKLVQSFRRDGYEVEYCGCYEYTPANNLLHWHGILRVKGGFWKLYAGGQKSMVKWIGEDKKWHSDHSDANEMELGKKWFIYHQANQVDLDEYPSFKALVEYLNKHMVKDYSESQDYIRNKFLVSRGWKRAGIEDITGEFKRWWVNGCESGSWMGSKGYRVMNNLLRGWAEKRNVFVKTGFGWFQVNEKTIDSEIYGKEI